MWKSVRPGDLLWEVWESDSTVYDRHTGETHLLSPLPAELLHLLSGSPMTLQEVSCKLADLCGVECTREWLDRTARMLEELVSLSLIEKQPV